jgi:seryl-tRNA synthetase
MKTSELTAEALTPQLRAHGLLVPTATKGVYGFGATFDRVLQALDRAIVRLAGEATFMQTPELFRFPPVLHRDSFLKTDYLASFPDLIGAIHCFHGSVEDHRRLLATKEAGGDWGQHLEQSDLTLVPAACYPVYAMVGGGAPLDGPRTFDVFGQCFRHEPSDDPARMQSFRMHEFVHVGTVDSSLAHRDHWVDHALAFFDRLQLPVQQAAANDPFFGRAGKMLAANQRENELKWELVVPVSSDEKPTAIASCNRHLDHLTASFDIALASGETTHSACVGFGMERCTLALFRWHGLDPDAWPAGVRDALEL